MDLNPSDKWKYWEYNCPPWQCTGYKDHTSQWWHCCGRPHLHTLQVLAQGLGCFSLQGLHAVNTVYLWQERVHTMGYRVNRCPKSQTTTNSQTSIRRFKNSIWKNKLQHKFLKTHNFPSAIIKSSSIWSHSLNFIVTYLSTKLSVKPNTF